MLVLASAMVIGVLGSLHLLFTYHGPKLLPRDASIPDKLKAVKLHISSESSFWRAWIGFNASHSLGVLSFALVYGYLALFQGPLLFNSAFLGLLGGLVLVSYAVLARLYWFSSPFRGIVLALFLYLAGFIAALAS